MSRPSVSVIVATRDRPQLLRRAVASILGQRYDGPIEVIAVFDQSEPDLELARSGTDRSVRVITNTRRPGLPGGRNSGIAQSDRDLIAFCDDDDLWLPRQAGCPGGHARGGSRRWRSSPPACWWSTATASCPRVLDRDRITFTELVRDRVMEAHPSSYLARRSAVEAIGPVDEDIPGGYAEDWDWLLRAARRADVGAVTLPLVKVFWHASSYFSERWQMIADATDYLLGEVPGDARRPRRAWPTSSGSSRSPSMRSAAPTTAATPPAGRCASTVAASGRWSASPARVPCSSPGT